MPPCPSRFSSQRLSPPEIFHSQMHTIPISLNTHSSRGYTFSNQVYELHPNKLEFRGLLFRMRTLYLLQEFGVDFRASGLTTIPCPNSAVISTRKRIENPLRHAIHQMGLPWSICLKGTVRLSIKRKTFQFVQSLEGVVRGLDFFSYSTSQLILTYLSET